MSPSLPSNMLAPPELGQLSAADRDDAGSPFFVSDLIARRLYFQGLGCVSLIAFVSLWSQIHGLIGSQGLLPAGRFFELAYGQLGTDAYRKLPSACWFASSDIMLHVWCASGTLLGILLIVGIAPRMILVLLWGIYLSLTVAGQQFLSFQWDTLLLEMLVTSLLYAPRGWRPDWTNPSPPLPIGRWLVWLLAFKLMFLSGVTKLLSGDTSWYDGTALEYHYFTQPIPSWPSWYAYQLPIPFHRTALGTMFFIELVAPFLIFIGRWGRAVFAIAAILLMAAIELTGNFGFFNLQTAVLCVPLIEDVVWRRLIPTRLFPRYQRSAPLMADRKVASDHPAKPFHVRWRFIFGTGFATCVLFVSMLTLLREMVRTQQPRKPSGLVSVVLGSIDVGILAWGEAWVLIPTAPYRTVNGYGLFRVMTTRRPEIIVETSQDGLNWTACEFRYKPGNIDRVPPIVAPHMPRLDWQMWFAALNPRGSEAWLSALVDRILEGNATTARLVGQPELANHPPRFVRMAYYEYKFSTWEQRRATGAWWSRSRLGDLVAPRSRHD